MPAEEANASVPGRLPAARGRAVALRAEPPGYRRLAPDGLPSLTRTQSGQRCRRSSRRGPFPCPGIAGFMSVLLRRTDARLAIGPARRSLRSVLARPERHPGHRHARRRAAEGQLRQSDRHGSADAPVVRCALLVSRRPQRRRGSCRSGRLRCNRCARRAGTPAATLRRPWGGAARAPVVSPRSPQLRPRQLLRGTCGGIFKRWAWKLAHCFGC